MTKIFFSTLLLIIISIGSSADAARYSVCATNADGAILVDEKFKVFKCPAFAKKTVDKVGAGDTMLAIASMGLKFKLDPELVLFMSSLAASISVESIGNKESVTVEKIDRMIEYILK